MGFSRACFKGAQFRFHGAAGVGGNEMGDAFRRGVGAVGGGEGVIHENVAEAGQHFGKARIVLFLAGMIAGVFHQHAFAGLYGNGGCRLPIGEDEFDRAAELA